MITVHLTSSTFFGGPERQMLGLANALVFDAQTVFCSFKEGGLSGAFLDEAQRQGFEAHSLEHDTPNFSSAVRELTDQLRGTSADILFCHGYKSSILGRFAARRAGIPVVAVSRGWTYENSKVRVYELLDRINLRWMDRVVCVSEAQAAKVLRAGVPEQSIVVIPNAIDSARFRDRDPGARLELENLFPQRIRRIVGAVGRLSPEKGFTDLIDAAALIARQDSTVGFALFGDGVLEQALRARIVAHGLSERFVLAGFRPDLDRVFPHLDLLVQSSHTEGMPNVVLEACAAGVPVVATAVGGTPEIVEDSVSGHLVPIGDPATIARVVLRVLDDEAHSQSLANRAQQRIRSSFTFEAQAASYRALLHELTAHRSQARNRLKMRIERLIRSSI